MIRVEIEGIHDLIQFVRIIRNETITAEEIERLVRQLNRGTEKLQIAVEENQPPT